MSLIFLDSFDHYATALIATKYTQVVAGSNDTGSLIGAVGRRSTNGLRLATVNSVAAQMHSNRYRKVCGGAAPPSGATFIAGFAFRCVDAFTNLSTDTTDSAAACLIAVYQGSAVQCWLKLNTNGTISAYRGTTLLGTTSNALTQNVYSYIEVKIVLHNSTGTVDIEVDGISWLALTGQDTQNTASATWDEFAIGPVRVHASGACQWEYDDLYIADGAGSGWTTFKGDTRIDAVFPNAVGNASDFTRSTGADQWATIDEASANSDTDYNASSTVDHIDKLNFPNAPVAGADIHGVQVVVQARKTDSGGAGHKAVTRISGADFLGVELGLTSAFSFLLQPWDLKPSDATPWTDADFNAAEFGYKKTA